MKTTITATDIAKAVLDDPTLKFADFNRTPYTIGWLTKYVFDKFGEAVPQSALRTAMATIRAVRCPENFEVQS